MTSQESEAQPGAPRRPNIVFVFSDDHASHAISAYGSRINTTPNLDRLAHEGMRFENCFCGNSICGPSRATVLTGLHSHANGFRQNGDTFDGGQRTLPKLLRAAGYATALIGKWHLGSDPQGFDHWEVLPGQGHYYNPDLRSANGRRRVEGYVTDVVTDLAIEWLEKRDREKPFLLMCQHKAPHRSWEPGPDELGLYADIAIPEPATLFDDHAGHGKASREHEMGIAQHMYFANDLMLPLDEKEPLYRGFVNSLARMTPQQRERYEAVFAAENAAFRENPPTGDDLVRWKYQRYIKNYLRCVAGVDKSVGRLLDWLRDEGLADDTVVVYSSDQGFYLGDRGWYDKRWMYEESLRMPLLVRWPGHTKPGTTTEALAQNIDFAPTFLDMAGVEVPDDMHGRSLVPLLRGESVAWRRSVYYHYYESRATHRVAAHFGVRTERYKLIRFPEPEHDYWELFDLEQDPGEVTSVWGRPEYAEVQKSLEQELERLRSEYGVTDG